MAHIPATNIGSVDKSDLRCGIFLPPFHALDEDPTLCIQRDFELLEHLDRLGFEEAWIGEHHSGGFEIIASPELFIAAAAERTSRIRLGTGVVSLPYHHPYTVAGRIAQLDHQTKGRAMFGFGPGLLNSDAQMLGIRAETQRERMGEALDVIVRLLDGEIVTRKTDWFEMNNARLQLRPWSKRRPHLAVTSTVTPNGAMLAGKHDLGMLCVAAASGAGYSALDSNWSVACREAEAAGRTMDRSQLRIMAPMHIAETREQAIADLAFGFEKWAQYAYHISPIGPASIGLGSIEEMIEKKSAVIGTPDDAVEQLERYWEKTGGFGCMLILGQNWASPEVTRRSFDLIARHVLPKFCGRNDWRTSSYDWMGDNREAFSAVTQNASRLTIEKFAAQKG
ncbi:MAG: luciferase-like protein [Sphingomonas bacterium]|nr:luciferase-like protein [Sphingomonas bacterium]MDB5718012.1 luciferase-like protein [Sphingomonas bacterium]